MFSVQMPFILHQYQNKNTYCYDVLLRLHSNSHVSRTPPRGIAYSRSQSRKAISHLEARALLDQTSYPRSSYHCEGLISTGTEKKFYLATHAAEFVVGFVPDEFIAPTTFVEDMISAASKPYRDFCQLDYL